MSNRFISICIPYFNAQRFFSRCLRSICNQDFRDFEIVILDDGSSDPLSIDVLRSQFPDAIDLCVKVVRTTNGGTYAARQRAIGQARGEYILCVDADDRLADSEVLGVIAKTLRGSSLPDVLMFNVSREDGARLIDYSGLGNGCEVDKGEVIRRFFAEPGWNSMFSLVFRRDLFMASPGRPKLLMAEDRLQKAEILAKAKSFFLLDEPLYVYCDVVGSKMNSPFDPQDFYDRVYVNKQIREMLQELHASEAEWAISSNGYIMASLLDLARSTTLNRNKRMSYYRRFRDEDSCVESLAQLDRRGFDWKDYECLSAFSSRRWVELDLLLRGRSILSIVKRRLLGLENGRI